MQADHSHKRPDSHYCNSRPLGSKEMNGMVTGIHASPAEDVRPVRLRPPSLVMETGFRWLLIACALAVLGLLAFFVFELYRGSIPSIHQFGWKFFTTNDWDPVAGSFGALPFIYGTLVSSFLALLIAVPLAVGTAVFLTEMC